jgi:hypothetical protein
MQATASLRTPVARPTQAGQRPRSRSDAPIIELAFHRSHRDATGAERVPCAAYPGSPCWQRPGASAAEVNRHLPDHDRIAQGTNDAVVHRIFATGLYLQAALGLIGEHQGASKIYHAIDELDQAIRDIRDTIFGLRLCDPRSFPGRGGPGKAAW